MKITQIAKICGGQDGAIFENFLFRFDHKGSCTVYDLSTLPEFNGDKAEPIAGFTIGEEPIPHSNAVCFGKQYYAEGDEFPLLYSNIYNNYRAAEDPLRGVCCVYRITRKEERFSAKLVQLIKIGFIEYSNLWLSSEADKRPYGNFLVDPQRDRYYGFTMRDAADSTRYFVFDLPNVFEGEPDEVYGVKSVVLGAEDIKGYFDCEYHRFLQGGCVNNGKIYSTEGFTESCDNPPALRVISLDDEKQELFVPFGDFGLTVEPELIDFWGETCCYADNHGNLYTIEF